MIPTPPAPGRSSVPIEVERVEKRYGAFRALDQVSLTVGSGEFVTLLGPSGSGKTTLLMIVAGFVRADAGSVRFAAEEMIDVPPHRRGVGMVFQNYALFPHMTVAQNVAYPLKVRRLPAKTIADRVAATLDLVQLGAQAHRKPSELSGGQRQRVALARAVVFEPRILLMDEPLSALDKNLREAMQFEIRRLHDRLGVTTLYVTHDQREALTMSDRVVVMRDGRIEQVGTPAEIYEKPLTRFVGTFVGESWLLPIRVDGGRPSALGRPLHAAVALDWADGTSRGLLVRPERVVLAAGREGQMNVFEGRYRDLVYQGDTAMLRITLDDGSELGMRRPANDAALRQLPAKGAPLALALSPDDVIVVRDDGPAGKDAQPTPGSEGGPRSL